MHLGNMVIYGAGSIGSTIGGWMTPKYSDIYLIARGEHAKAMKVHGLSLCRSRTSKPETVAVNLVNDLKEVSNAKVVVLTVKTYDLIEAANDISSKLGDDVLVVALQNGVDNQRVLPDYFSKVIYGIVGYSGMVLKPGFVIYQSKGPIYLGTIGNKLQNQIEEICQTFNLGFETEITRRFQDTVHSKIVLNLTNALFTLVGLNYQFVTSYDKLATLASNLVNEGIHIVQKAGYKEYPMKNYPTWRTLRLGLKLPSFFRTRVLKKTMKHMITNSMGQDVLQRKKKTTELDAFNGYIVALANSIGISAPYNNTLHKMCKEKFRRSNFKPLAVDDVWDSFNPIR